MNFYCELEYFEQSRARTMHVSAFIYSACIFTISYMGCGSRGVAKGAAAPAFIFFSLIIIHIIHCCTHYFNLQAGVKIVIITIVKIITFITNTCTHAN